MENKQKTTDQKECVEAVPGPAFVVEKSLVKQFLEAGRSKQTGKNIRKKVKECGILENIHKVESGETDSIEVSKQ